MKNIKKLTFYLAINFCGFLTAFSQKITLVDNDTLICFSTNQSKFLLKQVYRAEMLDTLLKLELGINNLKSSQIQTLQNSVELLRLKEKNLNEIILNYDGLNKSYENEIKRLKKSLICEKIKKTIFSSLGALTSGVFLYLYLTK